MSEPMTEPIADGVELSRNAGASRYELHLDGTRVGLADYFVRGEVVVIPHTETFPGYGGRGFATRLVRFALDDIAAAGRKVDPVCPFVAAFIRRNPEYASLLAGA
jgi:uncharacterized protein